mmetsp:Transcript_16874/g.46341  ORF Transcript_16874/g.46341 Transcript_16874/m.46341 type:complete len:115 (+) Transcript_16874:25-369(+)
MDGRLSTDVRMYEFFCTTIERVSLEARSERARSQSINNDACMHTCMHTCMSSTDRRASSGIHDTDTPRTVHGYLQMMVVSGVARLLSEQQIPQNDANVMPRHATPQIVFASMLS